MLRVLELFAGIGACSKALERLGIEHEIVDAVEIDKFAIASFNALHGTNFEPQDITAWDKDIEVDFIMHGSPCQDFSVAGKGAGGDEGSGTRSSLMYETLRIVEKLKPKYVIWENVKNLLSKKHRHNFDAYLERMSELGYGNKYQVLNAKDHGIPQNRERVFTVSILGGGEFDFPDPIPLDKKLKDVLETEVDEKYYLSDKIVAGYLAHTERHKERGNGFKFEPTDGRAVAHAVSTKAGQRSTDNFIKVAGRLNTKGIDQSKRVYSPDGLSPTLSTMQGGGKEPKIIASRGRGRANMQKLEPRKDGLTNTITSVQKDNYVAEPRIIDPQGRKNKNCIPKEYAPTLRAQTHGNPPQVVENVAIKTANKQGYDIAYDGDGADLAYPDSKTRRGRVGHGMSKTIPASSSQGVLDGVRIRKLTPKECWRLMGFDDTDFEKAAKANSNTQLYKQAGNSIVVNVLEAILANLLGGHHDK